MYTNTVVRCCTDVFWRIHFMFCSLSVYSTMDYIAEIKCIESQSEWFIIEAQYLFYEPINDLLTVRLTTRTILNTMCEVWSARCAICDLRCAFISMNVRAGLLRIFQPFFKNLEPFSTAETILFAFALLLSYLRNYRRALNRLHSLCW